MIDRSKDLQDIYAGKIVAVGEKNDCTDSVPVTVLWAAFFCGVPLALPSGGIPQVPPRLISWKYWNKKKKTTSRCHPRTYEMKRNSTVTFFRTDDEWLSIICRNTASDVCWQNMSFLYSNLVWIDTNKWQSVSWVDQRYLTLFKISED